MGCKELHISKDDNIKILTENCSFLYQEVFGLRTQRDILLEACEEIHDKIACDVSLSVGELRDKTLNICGQAIAEAAKQGS